MNSFNQLYLGVIQEVYSPGDPLNASKYQYEYRVLISGDGNAQIPCKCIRMDPYGSYHNYQDAVLSKGYRVFVQFPRGDRSMGVIMGGSRFRQEVQDPKAGIIYEHRFNEVVNTVDFTGAWTTRTTSGTFLKVEKNKVTISDTLIQQPGYQNTNFQAQNNAASPVTTDPFDGEFIILDKAAGQLWINTNQFKVVVNKNADIHVRADSNVVLDGAATITVGKDANVTVNGNANVNVAKDLQANVTGELKATVGKDATITSSGSVKVSAKDISLQAQGASFPLAALLTTTSDPIIDYITGIPTQGTPTIKAGE
jgi:hypothetical protein